MKEKEFKVGDWVFLKMGDFQVVGIITEKAELGYVVKANNSYFQYVLEEYMERIDAKTAFLHDLSELLRKYDASVRAEIIGFEGMLPTMSYTIGNEQFYLPQQGYITADNIMDFDKE